MNLSEFIRLAWESISGNKMRSLLTMLGIIIGVASVIIMIGISAGTEAAIEEQITGLGSNLVFVTRNFSRGGPAAFRQGGGLVYEDASAIADNVNGVVAVIVEQPSTETVKAGNVVLDGVAIRGSTADLPSARVVEIDNGRYFT